MNDIIYGDQFAVYISRLLSPLPSVSDPLPIRSLAVLFDCFV